MKCPECDSEMEKERRGLSSMGFYRGKQQGVRDCIESLKREFPKAAQFLERNLLYEERENEK